MELSILAERDAVAQARLLNAAELLAQRFHLEEQLLPLKTCRAKDLRVEMMKQRAALADLLDALLEVTEVKLPLVDEDARKPASKARRS